MKLIGAVTSPYVRKVRIVMAEKNSNTNLYKKMSGLPAQALSLLTLWGKCRVC
jgi:glutathione S-transferase